MESDGFLLPLSKTAVVELWGIVGGAIRPSEYEPKLGDLVRDKSVRAVLLDIDSPGGSSTESEYLQMAVEKIAAVKPVISFIRGSCLSSSYIIACAATRIVSMPGAIVGAIGVVSVTPILRDFLGRFGIRVNLSSDRTARTPTTFLGSYDGDPNGTGGVNAELYDHFIETIMRRRNLDRDSVEKLATRSVFTGRRAVTLGLVDELGDRDYAIELARSLGRASRRLMLIRPKRSLIQRVVSRLTVSIIDEIGRELEYKLGSASP